MSNYFCAHCGQSSSMCGHFMRPFGAHQICPNTTPMELRDGPVGFCCPPGHVCEAKPVPEHPAITQDAEIAEEQ